MAVGRDPRIAVVAPWLRGGASRSALLHAQTLAATGAQLELVGVRADDARLPSGPNVRAWELDEPVRPGEAAPHLGPLLERVLAAGPLDLLHAHYAFPFGEVAAGGVEGGTNANQVGAFVLSLHGTDVTRALQAKELANRLRGMCRRAACTTTPSRHLAQELRRGTGCTSRVWGGAVDLERFRPGPTRRGPLRVVSASGFAPWKRAPRLVRAFALALERCGSRGEGAELVLLGEGVERARAASLARELGLGSRVRLPGAVDAPERVLRSCDLMASAAAEESFGLALLEGLACGLPLVATRVGGVAEWVGRGPHARLVPADDMDALATALADCLARPREMRSLRTAARTRAEAHGLERWRARMDALYRPWIDLATTPPRS